MKPVPSKTVKLPVGVRHPVRKDLKQTGLNAEQLAAYARKLVEGVFSNEVIVQGTTKAAAPDHFVGGQSSQSNGGHGNAKPGRYQPKDLSSKK